MSSKMTRGYAVLVRLARKRAEAQAKFKAAWDAATEPDKDAFARLAVLGDPHAELEPDDGPTKPEGRSQ